MRFGCQAQPVAVGEAYVRLLLFPLRRLRLLIGRGLAPALGFHATPHLMGFLTGGVEGPWVPLKPSGPGLTVVPEVHARGRNQSRPSQLLRKLSAKGDALAPKAPEGNLDERHSHRTGRTIGIEAAQRKGSQR